MARVVPLIFTSSTDLDVLALLKECTGHLIAFFQVLLDGPQVCLALDADVLIGQFIRGDRDLNRLGAAPANGGARIL